jgi:hypothetical protein
VTDYGPAIMGIAHVKFEAVAAPLQGEFKSGQGVIGREHLRGVVKAAACVALAAMAQ